MATYSGRPVVARSFIRQQQWQHSSAKLLTWCGVYLGYSVPLPWCTKGAYRVRYAVRYSSLPLGLRTVLFLQGQWVAMYTVSRLPKENQTRFFKVCSFLLGLRLQGQWVLMYLDSQNRTLCVKYKSQSQTSFNNVHSWNLGLSLSSRAVSIHVLYTLSRVPKENPLC